MFTSIKSKLNNDCCIQPINKLLNHQVPIDDSHAPTCITEAINLPIGIGKIASGGCCIALGSVMSAIPCCALYVNSNIYVNSEGTYRNINYVFPAPQCACFITSTSDTTATAYNPPTDWTSVVNTLADSSTLERWDNTVFTVTPTNPRESCSLYLGSHNTNSTARSTSINNHTNYNCHSRKTGLGYTVIKPGINIKSTHPLTIRNAHTIPGPQMIATGLSEICHGICQITCCVPRTLCMLFSNTPQQNQEQPSTHAANPTGERPRVSMA